jgi:hypothetical protein
MPNSLNWAGEKKEQSNCEVENDKEDERNKFFRKHPANPGNFKGHPAMSK